MSDIPSPEELLKSVQKTKDGDQLFDQDEDFKALMGDDEDTLAIVFQHVSPDDDGSYTCVAKTTRGILSFEAVVHGEVHVEEHTEQQRHNQAVEKKAFRHWKPSLSVENTDMVVKEGDQAMLQVKVNGYPKPDIRCTKDDIPIKPSKKYRIYHEDEDSLLLLVIKDVEFSDCGIYSVMAENETGFDSVEIKLTVIRYKYPQIKTTLEDLSIHTDQTLIIPVEVDGIPTPIVQFMKENREIEDNEHFQISHKDQMYCLTIVSTTLQDTGVYSVVVTNELAQISQFWGVYVYCKPKLVEKLGKNLQLAQGEEVILKAKIVSEPRSSIQWYKNSEEILFSDNRIMMDDDDGFYTLKIKDLNITDSGTYMFKASNAHGVVDDVIRIDVKKAPTILERFEDAIVIEQDVYHYIHVVTFGVKLEAFPKPTVKWFLDGDEIPTNRPEYTRVETDNEIKLVINEVTTDLSGDYDCIISNECGTAEASAKLTVNCCPRILSELNNVTIPEHNTLFLQINTRGYPAPRFIWTKDDKEIEINERTQIGLEAYGKYRYKIFCIIKSLIYEDKGAYEVVVSNQFGEAKSKCDVIVHVSPRLLETNMENIICEEGSDITFFVKAFADPHAEAKWTWEDTNMENDGHLKIISSHNNEEFRLGLRKLKAVDSGVYRCIISNYVGHVSKKAVVDVKRKKKIEETVEEIRLEIRQIQKIDASEHHTVSRSGYVVVAALPESPDSNN